MRRFERLCWLWAADNGFIRRHVSHRVRFEDLLKDFDSFDRDVLQFLGLEMKADGWQRDRDRVYNSTPRYTFPQYAEWSTRDRKAFDRICGEEMAVYGY